MTRTGLQRTQIRILLTVLTLAMMAVIFWFSREPAARSDRRSGEVSQVVVDVAYPDYPQYSEEKQKTVFNQVQHIVRKCAHFTEYAMLGLLMRLCLESWVGRRKWLIPVSWLGGTLYAVTDELHQLQIDGRSGQWTDVLLDSAGVLTGVLIISLVLALIRKKNEKGSPETECP